MVFCKKFVKFLRNVCEFCKNFVKISQKFRKNFVKNSSKFRKNFVKILWKTTWRVRKLFNGDLQCEFTQTFFYVFLLWVLALPITIEVRKILNVTNYYWIFSAFGYFWDLPPSSQVCVFSSKEKKNNFYSYIFYGSFTFVFIGSLLCCIQLANWHNFLMSNQCKRVVPRRVTQQVLARLSSLCCCCYSLSGAKHDRHINNF